jgi:hypothetical protein
MTNIFDDLDLNDFLQDAESLPDDMILLSPEQMDEAMKLSDSIADPTEQWQMYLQVLARLGVQQWFQERSPRLSINQLPHHQLQVNDFKLGILAIGGFMDDFIEVAKTSLDNPRSMPHFHVLVEVFEEQEQVRVLGFLRQDEVIQQRQSTVLRSAENDDYLLPLNWFHFNPDNLLLYLSHLEPAAIPIPTPAPIPAPIPSPTPTRSPVVDVRRWVQGVVDSISWIVLPAPTFASEMRSSSKMRDMRSSIDQFERIISTLAQQDIAISSQARSAYQDISLGNHELRLYIITWEITPSDPPEWSLMAVLGTQSGESLPANIKLKVQDETNVLAEQNLSDQQRVDHLYCQGFGELNEQLYVAIEFQNGETSLHSFTLSA